MKVILFNHSEEDFYSRRGTRIAQLICEKIFYPARGTVFFYFLGFKIVSVFLQELSNTERGGRGFSSA